MLRSIGRKLLKTTHIEEILSFANTLFRNTTLKFNNLDFSFELNI